MGQLGVFDDDRSRWLRFDEDTEVRIRFLPRDALRKIQRKAEQTARLTGASASDIADAMVGHEAVLGWRKVGEHGHPGLVVNNKPLPFSLENVEMLMKRSSEFFRFVDENVINSRQFLQEERDEEESKNA